MRSALGALEGSEAGSRAKEVVTAAEAAHTKDEAAYEAARSRLADRLTQQSETQAALSRSGDVSGALQVIAAAAPDAPTELTMIGSSFRAAQAYNAAMLSAGKEPVSDSAALSPGRSPNCLSHITIKPANCGLSEVCFAVRLPNVVVMSE